MITALMLFAALSPYNTFNNFYLYQNNTTPPSYRLVSVMKLQQDQYELRTLSTHKGDICSKETVSLSDLKGIVPFYYGQRVYVNQGWATKSGVVVGQIGDSTLIHYEGKPCKEYATLVATLNIIPLN